MRPTSSRLWMSSRWVKSPSATDSSTRAARRSGRVIMRMMTKPKSVAANTAAAMAPTSALRVTVKRSKVRAAVFSMASDFWSARPWSCVVSASSSGSRLPHMPRASAPEPFFTSMSTVSWVSRSSLKSVATSFAAAMSSLRLMVAR